MTEGEVEAIRQQLVRFVDANGHGALSRLARETKLSRQFLSLVCKDKRTLSEKSATLLRSGLEKIASAQSVQPVITAETLQSVQDPVDAIAAQLEGMLMLMKDKQKFDYATRLALFEEYVKTRPSIEAAVLEDATPSDPRIRDLVAYYEGEYLPAKNAAPRTYDTIANQLGKFVDFCALRHVGRVSQLSPRIITEFSNWLRDAERGCARGNYPGKPDPPVADSED